MVTEVVTLTVTNPPKPQAVTKVDNRIGYGTIVVSKKKGVVRISLPAEATTSKGIGAGATFGEVKRVYSDAAEYRGGWWAKVDDNAYYAFTGDIGSDANEVLKIKLQSRDHDCALALL